MLSVGLLNQSFVPPSLSPTCIQRFEMALPAVVEVVLGNREGCCMSVSWGPEKMMLM